MMTKLKLFLTDSRPLMVFWKFIIFIFSSFIYEPIFTMIIPRYRENPSLGFYTFWFFGLIFLYSFWLMIWHWLTLMNLNLYIKLLIASVIIVPVIMLSVVAFMAIVMFIAYGILIITGQCQTGTGC